MDKRKLVQTRIEAKLLSLCEKGQYEKLESFLDSSITVDKNTIDTCFLATCHSNNLLGDYERILVFLLKKGANVNVKEKETEKTGLLLAVQNNNLGLIKLLLENKADPNLSDKNGKTPLLYAVSFETGENIDIVNMLLEYKANPELKAKDSTSPLLVAMKRSFEKISIALIKKMNDFSFREKNTGNSYLHIAAYRNMEPIVKTLLQKGLKNVDNFNSDCKLPSDLTINDKILELLNDNSKKQEEPKKDKNKAKDGPITKKTVKKKNSEKIEVNKLEMNKTRQRVSLKPNRELDKNMKCATTVHKEVKKSITNSVSKQKGKQDIEGK